MYKSSTGIHVHISHLQLCHAEEYITRNGELSIASTVKDLELYGCEEFASDAASVGPGHHDEATWELMLLIWKQQSKKALASDQIASVLA